MASSNRVFVSPGVYTSEVDLTFVAQSVGVTTLGVVGETLKGPAFEPVLISDFEEFRIYFGGTSPEKYGNGNPKYELGYVARQYLQESNQLFVTRVLGLTGYKPFNSFGIVTTGGLTLDQSQDFVSPAADLTGYFQISTITGSSIYNELKDIVIDGQYFWDYLTGQTYQNRDYFTVGFVDPNNSVYGSTAGDLREFPGLVREKDDPYWFNTYTNGTNEVYGYFFEYWDSSYGAGYPAFYVERYAYTASVNSDYENIVVCSLRPRGYYDDDQVLNHEVKSSSSISITSSLLSSDVFADFVLNVSGQTGGARTFTCSMNESSSKFVTKTLGTTIFDRNYEEFPLYVHESYPNLLRNLWNQGLIRGLKTTLIREVDGTNFMKQWDTAISPMVVSEVRGGNVADLFEVVTISDGDASNRQVKIQIQNINLNNSEFDIIVRDFYDTDDAQVIYERFSRCSMNPALAGYVAKKIGTANGEYPLRSKFIMLVMNEAAPIDAVPAGFRGFTSNTTYGTNGTLGSVSFKTKYYISGDVMYYDVNGSPVISNGDKVRKSNLGLSTQYGNSFDADLFSYKGKSASGVTYGFHLSVNASSITGQTTYQCTPYDLEGPDKGVLENINFRKFVFACGGGFDGWDIYRASRTNDDQFLFAKKSYLNGNTSNGGVFDVAVGNSDYYAYLEGIRTYANAEAVDINVFTTPGINFLDHNQLTLQAIDMIENDRADSLYIINSPNRDMAQDVIDDLDSLDMDSNYSATYWPWIQIRDADNSSQIFVPPTCEVVRNIALTDNVSWPWFAVAGYTRGIVNSIKATKKLTLDERDDLYKARINPIATFSDTGTIIWGNKTLQVRESALDRINVRRLLLRARKLISAVAVRLLFEQNDAQVRAEFLRLVNPILEAIKKERGLYEFRVSVPFTTEDLDTNTMRGKIFIKPTRALEFIELEFVITPSGASFENI